MDRNYFKSLAQECRAECQKYELPEKDSIKAALVDFESAHKAFLDAQKIVDKLKKKKVPEEEFKEAQHTRGDLRRAFEALPEKLIDQFLPVLEDQVNLENESEEFQVNLMKAAILTQSGAKSLGEFCKENDPSFITDLLADKAVMKEMLLNGGAKNGNWPQAYKLYKQLLDLVEEGENHDCHMRLAMATALELAEPIQIFDTKSIGGVFVDPLERFVHYVEAHIKGELDPLFPYFTTWEYRMVVDSDASDEQLQWGRDHLKRFRPDLATMDDLKWRYAEEARSEVQYKKPDWLDHPHTYKQLLSGGGKCGPRAWYGRFICKAFGLPTWGVRQPGHAAVCRWTPEGWSTCLGGGLHKSSWENRGGLDFQMEAHARLFQKDEEIYFRRVTLLECMAEAHEEKPLLDEVGYSPKLLWRSLVGIQRRVWWGQASKEHIQRGPGDEEELNGTCAVQECRARPDDPCEDCNVEVRDDGSATIPACAFVSKEHVSAVKCFEGGGQVHFQKKKNGEVQYEIPDNLAKGDYNLSCKVCTVHLAIEGNVLCIEVNSEAVGEVKVPYTGGDWAFTDTAHVSVEGGDTLKITRKGEQDSSLGLTMKEISLESS